MVAEKKILVSIGFAIFAIIIILRFLS